MITNKAIFGEAERNPRDLHHVMLTMILFTPEESEIRRDMESILSSLAFQPPEGRPLHMSRFPEIVTEHYGNDENDWPDFVKIMVSIFSLRPCWKPETSQPPL